jgi:hypothetical protein
MSDSGVQSGRDGDDSLGINYLGFLFVLLEHLVTGKKA